ncbi:MAG TPA: NADH-ubiquinone oxidoreductase-F iron-sulfur binding region domain-containing protein [Opitutaceae bacterium]|nr:NADH-ubiquinone oxidoreductase-F iron-sulfur binding region domain-containing protein [Opitutaceae bacterium]
MTKVTSIHLCAGAGCVASGSLALGAAFRAALAKRGLSAVKVVETGCLGPCAGGPVLICQPEGILYQKVAPADVAEIVEQTVGHGVIVDRLVWRKAETGEPLVRVQDNPFFSRQVKIALRNCGVIDPLSLDDYLAHGGYTALRKALTSMTPEQVIDEVKNSGLRGRGGAGFPTGLKWELCRKAKGDLKYVLCNGDEGDPGAFMDRSLLEGDPHSVIEAMIIAGYAIGGAEGYAYVRAEYPLAVERLGIAIGQARQRGFLGRNILGSGHSFDLDIRMGSGAFVCGEETALMTSIEGKRGEPRPRPPFPAQAGLWGRPSLLNNVETYANIPIILTRGAAWYAAHGTERSKGTKVFALAGAVRNTGLVEIPIGTPLGDIIYELGGGIPQGKRFKAAQLGGPSGGCIPRQHLNVPVDYESLQELGAIMGSGGLIVMDEDTCMVDIARFFLDFVQDESCGKCPPCRIGTKRMLEIVTRICNGQGEEGDIERLESLGRIIRETSLCGLGQTAPNPVLSTIRYFRAEYEAHIREKRCPAGVCPNLVRAPCQSACPANVDVPGFIALVSEKRIAEALRLHRERNPFAAVCARVCFHTCEEKCRRAMVDAPLSIRGVKRFMVDEEVTLQVPEVRPNEDNARRKIAIIGAGPAGLSCAYFLARLGYRPQVFEGESRPGGMPVQTIPAYRLPREILSLEVRMIERMGVTIETNRRLGRDFSLRNLREQGFEAVFLGVGAPVGLRLGVPGDTLPGVDDAIRFLREYNIRGSAPIGRTVVVVGGGNAAIDTARSAIRLGAQAVTVLYRRTREEMPAYAEEIEEAEHEGVVIKTLTAPVEIVARNGRVAGIKCQTMTLGEFDRSGRRRPTAAAEEPFVIPADQAITAIGQSLEPAAILDGTALPLTPAGFIAVDPLTGRTSLDWLYSGGDAALGPSSVVEAVAGGERAAVAIDAQLTGAEHAFWRRDKECDVRFDPAADPVRYPRARIGQLPVEKRRHNFNEVELPWTEAVALCEAKRCLRCDFREKP